METPQRSGAALVSVAARLHPLLHQNTSSLSEQRFSTLLSREDFFLSDHVVQGQPVLPGVAYLEMARAAVLASLDLQNPDPSAIELRDVVWARPLTVHDTRHVHICLNGDENGQVEFQVYTDEDERIVHAWGRASTNVATTDENPIDLSLLRSQCEMSFEAEQCYQAFNSVGLDYGPAHQGLTVVRKGTDAAHIPFVLARVALPVCISGTRDQYVLHPSVLDSALQASIGLLLDQHDEAIRPALPFALERLQIREHSPDQAWVIVQSDAKHDGAVTDGSRKWDVTICDDNGHICVRLSGLTSRVMSSEGASAVQSEDKTVL
ncbi:polyketide synthase dehydratase domain-containing protein, partial [Pseudomonas batumici]|uniref:polyketide synthase dehydratase domain-containing protein n=1 Tax=Pseudomonas batumici TaxID=226910 RepID=UPI001427ABE5